MIRVNLFKFYELGAALAGLSDVAEGTPVGKVFMKLWTARSNLSDVLDSKIVPLGTSRAAGLKLLAAIDAVLTPYIQSVLAAPPITAGTPPPQPQQQIVQFAEYNEIDTAKKTFETVLAAEMPGFATFSVQKKALFDTVELVERAEAIFSGEILKRMPAEAKKDICEAGRCLAFELYTATGFHIFRAMEAVIIGYYKSLPKAPPLKDSDRNWGRYIEGLRAGGADSKITDYLTYFKNAHRNPVTHPETVLGKDEAIAIFHALPNAIVPMINALPTAIAADAIPVPARLALSASSGDGEIASSAS